MASTEIEDGAVRTARRRDPTAHRAAILAAARRAFAENGYARTTIRDVAQRAGVTHGLVMRHFGSKQQLMLAAFPEPPGLAEVAEGDPATLPERLAEVFVRRMETGAEEEPLLAVIRSSAAGEQAAARLYDKMRRHSARLFEHLLPDETLGVRGDLVTSVLIGITFERYVMRTGELAAITPEALAHHLAGILRHILSPLLPPGSPPGG